MPLNGPERAILRQEIINAYPNREELVQLLAEKMELNFNAIARGSNYNAEVFNLIQDFEANGDLETFINQVLNYKPNSPMLVETRKIFATASPTTPELTAKPPTSSIKLTPQQTRQLRESLQAAFTEDELIVMLRDLGIELNNISANTNNYPIRVSDLVQWLNNRDRKLKDFLLWAEQSNPDNESLGNFVKQLLG